MKPIPQENQKLPKLIQLSLNSHSNLINMRRRKFLAECIQAYVKKYTIPLHLLGKSRPSTMQKNEQGVLNQMQIQPIQTNRIIHAFSQMKFLGNTSQLIHQIEAIS